ncbi:hypothetical protein [Thalassovita taeanensis]|uniref:Uncharacterized protein n=1 Tax=Thalassovita taeanensis TaxID=657014 RepID=A0A1H8YV11_9RHOB|nr:hypothetical protein [Thalassovita taeanensis]SEP55871.1 hypothetical protein SAMN04488092_101132 [Thalassovita taeanensis]
MSEISELERRITAAMDRIARGVEVLSAAPPEAAEPVVDEAELTELRQALDDERLANAQLEERVKAIRAKMDKREAGIELELSEARAAMAALDGEMQRLRQINEQLVESNTALRAANAEGVGAPDLINAAMATELEALHTARAAEAAEAGAIVIALEPLLRDATTGEET